MPKSGRNSTYPRCSNFPSQLYHTSRRAVIEATKYYPLVVHPNFFKSAKVALCAHIRSAEDLMATDGESLMCSIDDFRSKLATDSAFAAAVKACSTRVRS